MWVTFNQYQTLSVMYDDGVLTATINRPEALNALNEQVVQDLGSLLDDLFAVRADHDSPAVSGLILTGAGERAFVAGADIREMSRFTPDQAHRHSSAMHRITLRLGELPIPVIAAVNGYALGGGCELAMACDFIYASRNASFGQPEVGLGLVAGFGGTVRLQQFVGPARARELLFTGSRISAEDAQRYGLVSEVFDSVEDLLSGARSTLELISRQSASAVALTKAVMSAATGRSLSEALALEAEAFREAFTTPDSEEGTRAFLARETPDFPSRR